MNFIYKLRRKLSLTLFFSLITFLILSVSMLFMGGGFYIILHFKPSYNHAPGLLPLIFFMVILSLIFGMIFSTLLGRKSIDALRKLTASMEEVAHGNFQVRLNPDTFGPTEFSVLANSFNAMTEELSNYEVLRTDFVNNFSHEFKTPIVSLRGFAKLLKKGNLTPAEQNEYLDIIISEADRLSSLSTNILNLSNIENITILPQGQPFDLAEQLRRIILMLEPKFSKKQIEPVIELDDVTFDGNEDILGHVWINIIDNAIKFSPEHSSILISLKMQPKTAVVSITDQGRGMTAEEQKHIFDKFYQADTSHTIEGNGIGLAIVKKVVSLYHGSITCQSAPLEGTTFTITLPMHAES